MKATFRIILFLLLLSFLSQCRKDDPVVNIPDNNFLNALIDQGVDTNGDGKISPEEAEVIISLDVREKSIADMTGIEKFINLDTLNCNNNQLTSLDVSNNTFLEYLSCRSNQLTSLDVSNNNALNWFDCGFNQLTSLDVTNNTTLTFLICNRNEVDNLLLNK